LKAKQLIRLLKSGGCSFTERERVTISHYYSKPKYILTVKSKSSDFHGMSKDAWNRFSDEGYKHYQVIHAGYKYNMMDIQAAMGIHQLKRVDQYWQRRKNVWDKYNEAFKNLPCITPAELEPDTKHAYHLYTPLIDIEKIGKS
jgi:dTDP-4-amino-4,6-dideoxygalactose transaminase